MDNGVRLNAIGDLDSLPANCHKQLQDTIYKTSQNTRCTLTLALSYSSRWEITHAMKQIALTVAEGTLKPSDINEQTIQQHLSTSNMPDPELMIRTSGELRISNFLLWQLAYTELYFTSKLWPDFRRTDLFEAVLDYQNRERRFGMTSEQIH
jgi:undecaprenyl diphosphate synthase